MISDTITITSAFMIGLLGGVHCIGMCGGMMNALSFAIPGEKRSAANLSGVLLLYNLGRILSYTVIGALAGSVGWFLQGVSDSTGQTLRVAAGVMIIAMGLYLAGWWRGLAYLESLGHHVWRRIQPIGAGLLPVTRAWQALLLGSLWGWLPCGLVYSTLILAATSASAQQSAFIMAAFGLGTLPVMLATGILAYRLKTWVQLRFVRNTAALIVIAFGVWMMLVPLMSGQHAHMQHHNVLEPLHESSNHDNPAHRQHH
ncbi:MAG: sulfite exporter TauE/SafE family protein [Gammaproteobacteria bacterium]|nr:sulfite exporter TauE/SafE family protein [Gammaproteobacteria bacterium]